jgi:hypothetical protein
MKYNKIASILLLLSCVFVSSIIGTLFRRKSIFEAAARQRRRPIKRTVSKPSLASIGGVAALGSTALKSTTPQSVDCGKLSKKVSVAVKEATLAIENKDPNAENLKKEAKQILSIAKCIESESLKTDKIKHIQSIKSRILEILINGEKGNTKKDRQNALFEIMNDIILPNEANNLDIIKEIKNEAVKTDIGNRMKFEKIRRVLSKF